MIDDAIIVLENIERHREEGKSAREAARTGTREITFAAAAATFSVAAVFLPVAFASGQMGSFLSEFGVTVSVAVIISLFVALSLTPMLAARMPPPKERSADSVYGRLERWFQSLEERYRQVLDWSLSNRLATFGIAVLAIVVAVFAGSRLPGEFMPEADSGFIVSKFTTPPGTSLERTTELMQRNEDWFLAQPEVAAVFARIGSTTMGVNSPTEGMVNSQLVPHDERERSAAEIMAAARAELSTYPGQEIAIYDPTGSSDRDFEVEVVGSVSLDELDEASSALVSRLKASGGFVDLEKSLRLGLPEARIVPDREKAAAMGVDAVTLAEVVQAMIGGLDVAEFRTASADTTSAFAWRRVNATPSTRSATSGCAPATATSSI